MATKQDNTDALDLLTDLIGRAKAKGADAADAVLANSVSLSHSQRLGEVEKLERSESQDLGLRVLVGKKQAVVSSTDRDSAMLDELVDRALANLFGPGGPQSTALGRAQEELAARVGGPVAVAVVAIAAVATVILLFWAVLGSRTEYDPAQLPPLALPSARGATLRGALTRGAEQVLGSDGHG